MKTVFVSDIHMGAGRSFAPGYHGHVYDWLSRDEGKAFAAFLDHIMADDAIDKVILLGDIFDDWVYPVDDGPPSFNEILDNPVNRGAINNLRVLARDNKKSLVYVSGNHDMSVSRDMLGRSFPGMRFMDEYDDGGLYAGHGHAFTLFNAADKKNDPVSNLPIGYFISRIGASNAARTGSSNSFRYFLDNFVKKLFSSDSLIKAVIKAMLDEAGLDEDVGIEMPSPGGAARTISAKQVIKKYSRIAKDWDAGNHLLNSREAFSAELNDLYTVEFKMAASTSGNIFIFGHTHKPDLRKAWTIEAGSKEYIIANCGTWCESDKPCTFIETEPTGDSGQHSVKLCKWENNRTVPIRQETI